ncbi:TetR/AcrR family transcriptional regulator [Mycobacterium sp. BMJ-28]
MEVFAEVGFHGATIGDICERAGYTTGAFYSNFASKDELFLALFDLNAARTRDLFREVIAGIPDSERSLDRVVRLLATVESPDRRWFLISAEFLLYAIRNRQVAHLLAEHDEALRADLKTLFGGVLQRLNRPLTVDLDHFVRVVVAIREGGLAQSLIEPEALPPGTLEQTFIPILVNAVTTSDHR